MGARRSTSPSIMPVVAQAVAAQPPPVVVAAVEVQVPEDAVVQHRVRRFLQVPGLPVPGKPAQQRNLLLAAEVRLPLRRLRALAAEVARVVGVVPVVAVLRLVAAAVVVGVMPAALVVVVLQFRAWRSSICYWRPV